MSIANYSDLVAAVGNWLARTDLAVRVPEFITLAEGKFNRTLFVRQMEVRATTTTDTTTSEPEFISLPNYFQSMRRIRLSSVTGKPGLDFMSGSQIDEYRQGESNVTSQPLYFSIMGDEIELAPTPDKAYTIEMVYRRYIPALTSTNTTNWLLTLAPDLYLYGTLLEAAPYMKDDDRIPIWSSGAASAIEQLNKLNTSAQFNAGPAQIRSSGYTP